MWEHMRQFLKSAEYFRITDKQDYLIQVYNSDVMVKKPSVSVKKQPGVRADIFQFSKESARRLLFVCRNSGYLIKSQICLTFHEKWPLNGLVLKSALNNLLVQIRAQYPGVNYLWCLEFQKRGAPHFHLFTSIPVTDKTFQPFVTKKWLKITDETENAKCRWWHNRPENFFSWDMGSGGYIIKEYITKAEQKDVPEAFHNVGRFWGTSRGMKPRCILIQKDIKKNGGDNNDEGNKALPKNGNEHREEPPQITTGDMAGELEGTGRLYRLPSDLVVKAVRICKKLLERRLDNYKKLVSERRQTFDAAVKGGVHPKIASSMAKKKCLSEILGKKRVDKPVRIGVRETNMHMWSMTHNLYRVLEWLLSSTNNNMGEEKWKHWDFAQAVW